MRTLILVNGDLYKPDILRTRIRDSAFDMVLGADRGSCHARDLKVRLDAIVGDLDSTSSHYPEDSPVKIIPYPPEKDETDLELALLYARERGADQIVLVGAMGGRMDMIISNFLLLNHPALRYCRTEVWHGDQTGWLIYPPGEDIHGCPGDTVSLIPLGGDALDVLTREMKYPLRRERLIFGSSRGLSNLMESSSARVELSGGLLLAVHTPGRA